MIKSRNEKDKIFDIFTFGCIKCQNNFKKEQLIKKFIYWRTDQLHCPKCDGIIFEITENQK